jgi:hypothetical protein
MFKAAALKSAPGAEGELLDLLAQVTQSDIDDFRAGIEPLAAAGKIGSVAGAVSSRASRIQRNLATTSRSCSALSRITPSPWNFAQELELTPLARRSRC